MEIKIKIDAPGLEAALHVLASAIAYPGKSIAEIEEEKPNQAKTVTVEEVKETFEGEEVDITIEDIRAAFMAKNSKANKVKLKEILNSFGVQKVTDLRKEDFPAVLEALEVV